MHTHTWASQVALLVKNWPANARNMRCGFDSWREDSLEEGMATYPSILAWRLPWIEELGGLQSIRSQSQS